MQLFVKRSKICLEYVVCIVRSRRETWSWKILRFSGYPTCSDLGDRGLLGIKTSREIFELLNGLLLNWQDVVCSCNLDILKWNLKKVVLAEINRPHCFLDFGMLHNPGFTASLHYLGRFPLVILMLTKAYTSLWCLEGLCRNVKKGATVLKLEEIHPRNILVLCSFWKQSRI